MTLTTWLTIFLALVALSILIQAGIMLGLYISLRRVENIFSRWEPIILAKIGPIATAIEEKAHTYGDKVTRAVDRLGAYSQRAASTLSHQLHNTNRTVQTIDRRFARSVVALIPSKKKPINDPTDQRRTW